MKASGSASTEEAQTQPPLDDSGDPLFAYPAVVEGQPYYPHLPAAPRRFWRPRRPSICCCCCLILLLCIGLLAFFCWPRSIDVSVSSFDFASVHFSVHRIPGSIIPRIFIDISLALELSVTNPNYFGVTYDFVNVSIYYQDDEVGEFSTSGGDLRPRTTSFVNATLDLSGDEIVSNVFSLLEDVESGAVPLWTTTAFQGSLKLFWLFSVSLEGDVTCDIVVDPENQALLSEDCDL